MGLPSTVVGDHTGIVGAVCFFCGWILRIEFISDTQICTAGYIHFGLNLSQKIAKKKHTAPTIPVWSPTTVLGRPILA